MPSSNPAGFPGRWTSVPDAQSRTAVHRVAGRVIDPLGDPRRAADAKPGRGVPAKTPWRRPAHSIGSPFPTRPPGSPDRAPAAGPGRGVRVVLGRADGREP